MAVFKMADWRPLLTLIYKQCMLHKTLKKKIKIKIEKDVLVLDALVFTCRLDTNAFNNFFIS